MTSPAWRTTHSVLRCELAPDRIVVHHDAHLVAEPGRHHEPVELDGLGLETLAVRLDGRDLGPDEHTVTDRTLTVPITGPITGPGPHVVGTTVAVVPGPAGSKGFALHDGVLASNCEPEGFRRITWSTDRPSVRATYDVTLVADPAVFPILLANGDPAGDGMLDDGRHWARFVDPVTKPTYLFAAVGGDLRTRSHHHTTPTGRTIELRVVTPPDQIDGTDHALEQLDAVMGFDERHGGVEHDLDTLTFVAVPGYPDATEYHGLMFFEPSLLVTDQRGHVDDDLLLISANVAHEYGHHVRGNRITVRSWGQLALKEGLTVLMGQNDVRRHLLGPAARILDVLDLRRLQYPEETTIGAPVLRGEVDDPAQLYTRTTYLKGAEVFGMIRTLLGDDGWDAVFAAFVAEFDLGAAGVDDFVDVACRTVPDRADEVRAVARWFTLRGRPSIAAAVERDPDGHQTLVLRRTDALTDDPPVGIPFTVGFRDTDGRPVETGVDARRASEHTVLLDGRERRWPLHAEHRVVPAPWRGASAPVDLDVDLTDDELAVVLTHDDDAVSRWWAAETLMTRIVDGHRAGTDTAPTGALLVEALARVLRHGGDPLLLAQLLAVPDEFMLGDREPRIDVDGIAAGLRHLRSTLGAGLHDHLLATLDRSAGDEPGGRAAHDIARRWLVEPCLALLLATGTDEATAAAAAQLGSPDHTRAVRAFAQLLHTEGVDADDLVARTHARWSGAPRLVDRWIRAQSGARRPDTIDRVRRLADGPLYDRDDRARVMAVWFPFATRNRSVFHDPSGEGYRAFVDEVIVLMPRNAGLVVRLVGDLLQFRRFDDHRSSLLRSELERLADAPGMPDFAVGIVRHLLDAPG